MRSTIPVADALDARNQYPYAIDKGLYFISLELTIRPQR